MHRALLWFIVGLTLLAGSAEAGEAPVAADLLAEGPVRLLGPVRVLAEDAILEIRPPDAPDAVVLEVRAAEGALRVVRSSRQVVDNPVAGDAALPPEHHAETILLRDATLRVVAPREDFLALLVPTGGGRLAFGLPGEGARVLHVEPEGKRFAVGSGEAFPYYFQREVPAPSFRLGRGDAPLGILSDQELQVVLTGADLEVVTADGAQVHELGRRDTTLAGLGGQRLAYQREIAFAVLALRGAEATLAPGATAEFHSQAPTLILEGRLVADKAVGSVRAEGGSAEARRERVDIQGALRVAAEPVPAADGGAAQTRLRVEGQASRATVGGRALVSPLAIPPELPPLAAAAALAVAWLTGLGGKALALAAAPLHAAATPDALLENDRRRLIYKAVYQNPGIHIRELQRITGMRWGSLQYHVAVLSGTGLLRAAQAGRRTVLACDLHGLDTDQIKALHLLRAPRARAVARTVAEQTHPVTQRDVARLARVTPRLASRYLGLLERLRLVEASGNRPKRYVAAARLTELLPRLQPHQPAAGLAAPPSVQAPRDLSHAG